MQFKVVRPVKMMQTTSWWEKYLNYNNEKFVLGKI